MVHTPKWEEPRVGWEIQVARPSQHRVPLRSRGLGKRWVRQALNLQPNGYRMCSTPFEARDTSLSNLDQRVDHGVLNV